MTFIYAAVGPFKPTTAVIHEYMAKGKQLPILVSFFYMQQFRRAEKDLGPFNATQFMLDSGAYSAWSTKSSIDIEALIDEARNPQWSSVVALDVIGDHKASAKNTAHMKRAGLKVMPVFHIGDPWELLRDYCAEYEVVGLSKLARLVMAFAMRLQVQERMTRQIADAIQQHLEPCGVAVIVKARHSCMGHRGARQPGAEMITSAMLGCFRDDSSARSEFMRLAGDGEG